MHDAEIAAEGVFQFAPESGILGDEGNIGLQRSGRQ